MFNFLENLRAKPDKAKKHIAFLVALLFVGIIFVVWLSVIYPDFRQRQAETASTARAESPSPTSSFGSTFFSGISAIRDQVANIKNAVSAFSAGPAHYNATSTKEK